MGQVQRGGYETAVPCPEKDTVVVVCGIDDGGRSKEMDFAYRRHTAQCVSA